MKATLGGFEFVGDEASATYTVESISGWFDGGESRHESTPRPASHGDFDAPGFLGGGLITQRGLVLAASVAEYEAAVLALSGLLADGSRSEYEVEQDTITLAAQVRRHGKVDIVDEVYGSVARYQLHLWAPDPRRYGESNPFGPDDSMTVSHAGNFPAVPIVTIEGPVSAPYTVASAGHSVTVTQALGSGETHTIDMATGWVYLDGDLQAGVTSAVDVFTIPPGAGVTVTGPSTMTVDVVDTFA